MSQIPPPLMCNTFQVSAGWGWAIKRRKVALGNGSGYSTMEEALAALEAFIPIAKTMASEAWEEELQQYEGGTDPLRLSTWFKDELDKYRTEFKENDEGLRWG